VLLESTKGITISTLLLWHVDTDSCIDDDDLLWCVADHSVCEGANGEDKHAGSWDCCSGN